MITTRARSISSTADSGLSWSPRRSMRPRQPQRTLSRALVLAALALAPCARGQRPPAGAMNPGSGARFSFELPPAGALAAARRNSRAGGPGRGARAARRGDSWGSSGAARAPSHVGRGTSAGEPAWGGLNARDFGAVGDGPSRAKVRAPLFAARTLNAAGQSRVTLSLR